ncbi:MAG: sigma-70 family RNA polymerase sigma factor [Bacteroidetes bacterium]|nr:sigma-70 family RNA polymerase sigma factor [Bacteroidota bacterium]
MTKENNILIVWESFKLGDKEAFAYLYNLYVEILFRYGTKLCKDEGLVKDSIQEVFLDLYMKREKNKTNPENLKYYLILALKRSLIKKLKRNRKLVEEDAINVLLFEPEYSIEKTIIEQEQKEEINLRVVKLLNLLPAKQKEALYLRFNESLEYSEISQLLNISIESVRKQVYRALKTIRESFNKETFIFWMHFRLKNSSKKMSI